MEVHEIVQFALSGVGVVAIGAVVRLISWKATVDAKLEQFAERFDGSGNRRGLFAKLEDIEGEIDTVRQAGAAEHAAIRTEMHDGFASTDRLVDGLIGEFREFRGELRGAGVLHAPHDGDGSTG